MVKEEMHLQENTLLDLRPWPWGQGHAKCCSVPSTSCDLCTCKVWCCYTQRFRRRCIYKKCDLRTHAQMNGRWTDFGTKLIYPFLSKKKPGITSLKLKYPASGEGKTMLVSIKSLFHLSMHNLHICVKFPECVIIQYSFIHGLLHDIPRFSKKLYCIYNLLVCLPYFTIKCATGRHSIQCWINMCYYRQERWNLNSLPASAVCWYPLQTVWI